MTNTKLNNDNLTTDTINDLTVFCDNLESQPDVDQVIDHITDGDTDFTVDNVRFISADHIDQVLRDEILDPSDTYELGCYSAHFLSDLSGISSDTIKAMQKAELYQVIGEEVLHCVERGYSQWSQDFTRLFTIYDGSYGAHFNNHDGSEEEINLNGHVYYVFDNQ